MGTNIDLRVEVRKEGVWHIVNEPSYDERCYVLYAILADTRNYFAYRISPIAGCRGLPADYPVLDDDPHTFGSNDIYSHVSLAELNAYDWTATVVYDDGEVATLSTAVRCFYTDFLPALRKLAEPEDVRLVFGFN